MPGGYGSNYSGPGFYDSSGFEQFVGGTLSGAEGGLNLVTKIRDRKKKEERDTADEKRRADAAKRQQEEFERRQDEAGYERGGKAADRMDQLGEGMQDMPGGSITRMAGDLIAGNLRKYPDRWVKSKESKDEKAQRLREGTSVEVARVRAEAAADLERERRGGGTRTVRTSRPRRQRSKRSARGVGLISSRSGCYSAVATRARRRRFSTPKRRWSSRRRGATAR